ncbi:MAG TPA: NADPH:quinone oxidoreductase family protein [Actinomycetes bacterium]
MRAIEITQFGGPERLQVVDRPDPVPHDGLVVVEVDQAGVNYADTHQTEDTYLSRQTLPMVPGAEVVGRLDGRRVLAVAATGGYAERTLAHPGTVFALPDDVGSTAALAMLIQGATAWHLLRTSTHLAEGETVVVHAAAGGVGTIAVQLAKRWGAGRVIATASTPEKRALALELGADVAVDGTPEGLRDRLREANGGHPVDIVLEMTGGPVFDESLRALAPFGRLATFGMASRQAPSPVTSGELMRSSRAVIGFWLAHCFPRRAMMDAALTDLFGMVGRGDLRVVEGGRYPLEQARRAHEDLLARRTVGKLVLDVREGTQA